MTRPALLALTLAACTPTAAAPVPEVAASDMVAREMVGPPSPFDLCYQRQVDYGDSFWPSANCKRLPGWRQNP